MEAGGWLGQGQDGVLGSRRKRRWTAVAGARRDGDDGGTCATVPSSMGEDWGTKGQAVISLSCNSFSKALFGSGTNRWQEI
jgi:hypothetical protein